MKSSFVKSFFEKVLPRQNSAIILRILRKARFNHVSRLKLQNHLDIFLLKVSRKGKREIRKVLALVLYTRFVLGPLLSRTTDYRRPMKHFFIKTLGLGQTIWADKFWGIWGIFGWFSAPIFVLWVPCPCFPLFHHYFYEKLSLYIHIPNTHLGLGFEFCPQRIKNLAFVCP